MIEYFRQFCQHGHIEQTPLVRTGWTRKQNEEPVSLFQICLCHFPKYCDKFYDELKHFWNNLTKSLHRPLDIFLLVVEGVTEAVNDDDWRPRLGWRWTTNVDLMGLPRPSHLLPPSWLWSVSSCTSSPDQTRNNPVVTYGSLSRVRLLISRSLMRFGCL